MLRVIYISFNLIDKLCFLYIYNIHLIHKLNVSISRHVYIYTFFDNPWICMLYSNSLMQQLCAINIIHFTRHVICFRLLFYLACMFIFVFSLILSCWTFQTFIVVSCTSVLAFGRLCVPIFISLLRHSIGVLLSTFNAYHNDIL